MSGLVARFREDEADLLVRFTVRNITVNNANTGTSILLRLRSY